MATGRFLISRDATGAFRWVLRDAGGATVVESSEGFIEHKACAASVERLQKVASKAEVLDLTVPATVLKPKGSPKKKTAAAPRPGAKKGKKSRK